MPRHRFVGLGEGGRKIYLYTDKSGRKKARQVLWGDWLNCADAGDGWLAGQWHSKDGPVEYATGRINGSRTESPKRRRS